MKKLLSLFAVLLSVVSHAQGLKVFSAPKGYTKITEIKGDLDKDGKDEIILAFDTNQKASVNEDDSDTNDYRRVFYILKNENGNLTIWKENTSLLFSSGYGFYPSDNNLDISVKNNCLIIEQQFSTNSRHTQEYKHTFRFQNGDFYLIGSYDNFNDTCDFNFTNEINFSTGKVIIDDEYSSCDDDAKVPESTHKEFIHKLRALIKMNDFKIGDHKFKIPDSSKEFIF